LKFRSDRIGDAELRFSVEDVEKRNKDLQIQEFIDADE